MKRALIGMVGLFCLVVVWYNWIVSKYKIQKNEDEIWNYKW